MKKMKSLHIKNMRFHLVLQEEPEGGFTVVVPSLPGCITFGRNLAHAKKMAKEAIELYLEDLLANNEPLPQESSLYTSEIEVTVPSFSIK